MARRRWQWCIGILAVVIVGLSVFIAHGRGIWVPYWYRLIGERTVADVVAKYGPAVRARLKPSFERAGVAYPPQKLAILVFKKERRFVVWAANRDGTWRFVRDYPILAASGHAGPKLRQGDYQVPEGLYRIGGMNPMSSYHLSMRVDYPNAFDQQMAAKEGRTQLGGDIFIHGKNLSIGCIAIGDPAIEEMFTLVAETGPQRVKLILAPNDLRVGGAVMDDRAPMWVAELYRTIAAALAEFPVWMESNSAIDVRGMSKVAPRFK